MALRCEYRGTLTCSSAKPASRFQTFRIALFAQLQHRDRGIDSLFGRVAVFEDTVNGSQSLLTDGGCPLPECQLVPFRLLESLRGVLRIGVIPCYGPSSETACGRRYAHDRSKSRSCCR